MSYYPNEIWERQLTPETYGAKGALNAPTLTLNTMLTYALQDEYLAQARYDTIIQKFGAIRPFTQIKQAEMRHISALLPLFQRYSVAIPKNNAMNFVTPPATLQDAFATGVQAEIDNINMYDRFLTFNIPADMQMVFTQLRNASVNHLAAFQRGLSPTP